MSVVNAISIARGTNKLFFFSMHIRFLVTVLRIVYLTVVCWENIISLLINELDRYIKSWCSIFWLSQSLIFVERYKIDHKQEFNPCQ